jgi:glycosyltransferase involved in cell wall biosynthesis
MLNVGPISVIVPAYNVERFVADALESVLAQTRQAHEIIVIDDGSTDGTPDVLDRYRRVHGVTVTRTANRGPGPARNLGATLATGAYLYFFDSDDQLAPTTLATLEAAISTADRANRPDLVCFGGDSFIEPGFHTEFRPSYARTVTGRFTGRGAALRALFDGRNLLPNAVLYTVRRSFWVRHAFAFQPIAHEDEELLLPLLLAAEDVCVIPDRLYRRRLRPGSIMTGASHAHRAAGYHAVAARTLSLLSNDVVRQLRMDDIIRTRCEHFLKVYLSQLRTAGTAPDMHLVVTGAWLLRRPRLLASAARAWLASFR